MRTTGLLKQNCSFLLDFDENKVLKEQMDILTYIQVCVKILKINLEVTLIKTYEEKLKDSNSEGSKYDDSELGISASSDRSDSEDLS